MHKPSTVEDDVDEQTIWLMVLDTPKGLTLNNDN